jgi:hypothetical protein
MEIGALMREDFQAWVPFGRKGDFASPLRIPLARKEEIKGVDAWR